jgi:hypothetical protein
MELHLPGGRRDQAADDLRQRAFTRTVFTGQRQHFTAMSVRVMSDSTGWA